MAQKIQASATKPDDLSLIHGICAVGEKERMDLTRCPRTSNTSHGHMDMLMDTVS